MCRFEWSSLFSSHAVYARRGMCWCACVSFGLRGFPFLSYNAHGAVRMWWRVCWSPCLLCVCMFLMTHAQFVYAACVLVCVVVYLSSFEVCVFWFLYGMHGSHIHAADVDFCVVGFSVVFSHTCGAWRLRGTCVLVRVMFTLDTNVHARRV